MEVRFSANDGEFAILILGIKTLLFDLLFTTSYEWIRQGLSLKESICIPHICHFFSTGTIFGSIFLHAKVRKSRQNTFRDKTA